MGKEPDASHLNGEGQEGRKSVGDSGDNALNSDNSSQKAGDSQNQSENPEQPSIKKTSEEQEPSDTPESGPPESGVTKNSGETLSEESGIKKEEGETAEQPSPEQTYNPDVSPYSPEYQPPDYYSQTEQDSTASDSPESGHTSDNTYDTSSSSSYETYGDSSGSGGEPPADNQSDSDEEEEGGGPVKPFLEHLEDLRWTLIKSVTAVVLGMLICLVAGRYLVSFLMFPLDLAERLFLSSKSEVAIMMGTNVLARGNPDELEIKSVFGSNAPPALKIVPLQVGSNTILALQVVTNRDAVPAQKMVVVKNYSPIEGIMVALKLALFGGLVVSFPFVMYFIGQFVLPALHVHEKKILYKAVAFSGGLFLLGVVFCYFIVLVFSLGATVQFSQWLGFSADEWRADAYLNFVVKFMLGMGLAFQLPVIILLLVKIGLIDYEKLKKFRSYAFVTNLVVSAIVTPSGDPFTMLVMALPLHLLYEISTFVAWIWHRRELKEAAQKDN